MKCSECLFTTYFVTERKLLYWLACTTVLGQSLLSLLQHYQLVYWHLHASSLPVKEGQQKPAEELCEGESRRI